MKKFMSKPITWGSYFNMAGIVCAIALVVGGIYTMWTFWDNFRIGVTEFFTRFKHPLKANNFELKDERGY